MEDNGIIDRLGERTEELFKEFLEEYQEDIEGQTEEERKLLKPVYRAQIETMVLHDKTTIFVNFEHVIDHDRGLATSIQDDLYRFDPFLRKALQRVTRLFHPDYVMADDVPREFYVAFWGLPQVQKLRDLKPDQWVGKLASVSGTVTRTSEVRPELLYGTFQCMECGKITRDVEQQFKYTQPAICQEATCANREKWQLVRQECKFVDWQRVRMQESAEEVPAGSLPRTLDVILRHEIVEQARAGDKVVFTGTVVVVPDVGALRSPGDRTEGVKSSGGERAGTQTEGGVRGLKALGARDLTYKLCFIATSVQMADLKYGLVNIRADDEDLDAVDNQFTQEEKEGIYRMRSQERFMDKLVSSIAPAVFGHKDIKKAILLMLFGGVHKQTGEGIKLRGDINICIVGDPSCAKSQFLKYVAGFLPRAVYTSGKSSSAAGLTASVAKEPETGEFCIEAGALMLADNGICCIDEFDKMDVKDQVAIHEAMEQQTISIAKAGIQASLNARTSILAAANPTGGRYDKSKPLKYNVNLPPAILSRFDLVHVMIDEADENADAAIARHIVRVHQYRDDAVTPEFSTVDLQRYIKYARSIKPKITEEAAKCLQDTYVQLRRGDAAPGSRVAYRITVRQLEAMVRLSEALARTQLSDKITKRHVDEAGRLLSTSIVRVDAQDVELDDALDDEFYEEQELRGGPGDDDDDNNDDDEDVYRSDRPAEEDTPRSPAPSANGGAPSANGSTPAGNGTPASQGRATRSGSKRRREDYASPVKREPTDANADVTPSAPTPIKQDPNEADNKPDVKPDIKPDAKPDVKPEGRRSKKAKKGEVPQVSVSQDKIDEVKSMMVYRLRLKEKEAGDAVEAAGMKQRELLAWYFREQNSKGAFSTLEELGKDARLVKLIMQHLIRREGTLVELDDGKAIVEEAKAAHEAWKQQRDALISEGKSTDDLPPEPEVPSAIDERVLTVNPNFAIE